MASIAFEGTNSSKRQSPYATGFAIVAAFIVALRLLLHLLTANRYGIFRDELYRYYACGQHMAWGYVDMPPLIPAITWLFTKLLGSSLFVLRLIPALFRKLRPWLSPDIIAYQFGGKALRGRALGAGDCGVAGVRDQRPPARHQ